MLKILGPVLFIIGLLCRTDAVSGPQGGKWFCVLMMVAGVVVSLLGLKRR